MGLFQAIRSHTLAIWRDDNLVGELLNVQLLERSPGQFRLDHPSSGHDDQAVALAMAVTTFLERPASGGWSHLFGCVTCTSCSGVYRETILACPQCGSQTPERPEPATNGWGAVYRSEHKPELVPERRGP